MTGKLYTSGCWYVDSTNYRYRVATKGRRQRNYKWHELVDSEYTRSNDGLTAAVMRCRELGRKNQAHYKAL